MAQVYLNLPVRVPPPCLCSHCALISDVPSLPTPRVCLSESCLLFSAQFRCHLLQEGVPDLSPSALAASLDSLPFGKCVCFSSSFIRLRDRQRRGPCPWTHMYDTGSAGVRLCDLGQACSLSTSFFFARLAGSPGGLEGSRVSASYTEVGKQLPVPSSHLC